MARDPSVVPVRLSTLAAQYGEPNLDNFRRRVVRAANKANVILRRFGRELAVDSCDVPKLFPPASQRRVS